MRDEEWVTSQDAAGVGKGRWVLPGKSHGWRSLVGFSPWSRTESDTTEATWQQQQLSRDAVPEQNWKGGEKMLQGARN